MASALLRVAGSGALPFLGQTAGGIVGLSVLSDTLDVLTTNPIIPLTIMSIVLFVVLKKK
jgi:hypothetical protein